MGRKKRSSRPLVKAKQRLAGFKSIDPALNVGNGLTVKSYEKLITQFEATLEKYNKTLSTLDQLKNRVNDLERQMREASEKMLSGVACKFGKNSDEYEMAGGTRRGEIQRSNIQPDAPDQPLPAT